MYSRIAMAAATVACVSFAQAGFQINAVKTDAGLSDVVDLYFFNDGIDTGTALEAYELNYSGTPVQFALYPGSNVPDIYNESEDPTRSWLRIHPDRTTVFHSIPALSSPAWRAPITDFRVTYATFELIPLPANVGLGAHFGHMLVADGADFSLAAKVGGEIGSTVTASLGYFVANLPPEIIGAGTVTGEAERDLRTHRVWARDLDGQLLSFDLSDLSNAATRGFDIQAVGSDAFDITWDPSLVVPGNYEFDLVAQDSSVQANSTTRSTLTITVVPEPASLGAVASVALLARRRR